jgi:hypothetical protein
MCALLIRGRQNYGVPVSIDIGKQGPAVLINDGQGLRQFGVGIFLEVAPRNGFERIATQPVNKFIGHIRPGFLAAKACVEKVELRSRGGLGLSAGSHPHGDLALAEFLQGGSSGIGVGPQGGDVIAGLMG